MDAHDLNAALGAPPNIRGACACEPAGSCARERGELEQLRASRDQAIEASRLKSAFVANMSHELRTPLNGVIAMSELLLETSLSGEQRQYAQVALTSAEALMDVINGILDLPKIEAGRLEVVTEDFSIAQAVGDVCEIIAAKAREQRVALSVAIDERVPAVVRGDSARVRQVLTNLVGNAVKFTTDGDVTISVCLQRAGDGLERLRFEVSDTGIGIDADQLERVFESFCQADATTAHRYGGTGLGLCIAKQLVELMGGEIGCESIAGSGSTFWLTLACERGAAAAPDPADVRRRPASLPRIAAGASVGDRVLVAEDDAVNQFAAVRLLGKLGFAVDVARDGREAVEMSARNHYAAVFMDCQMPDVDGYTAARAIRRADPGDRRTLIIAMTAHALAGDRAKCLPRGWTTTCPSRCDCKRSPP
ncbi:MAG: ATP-binding protein [Solirubrobacteraceae bacterium]